MNATEQVRRHLTKHLGAPIREASFRTASAEVDVLKWDLRSSLGVFLYSTVGASRMIAPGSSHRLEFHLGLREARDDAADALAEVAIEPIPAGRPLSVGDTFSLPAPLWPRTRMRAFLVWSGRLKMVPSLELPDGTHLEMLSLLPIHPQELAAKQPLGPIGLMTHFRDHQVELSDPDRRPAAGLTSAKRFWRR